MKKSENKNAFLVATSDIVEIVLTLVAAGVVYLIFCMIVWTLNDPKEKTEKHAGYRIDQLEHEVVSLREDLNQLIYAVSESDKDRTWPAPPPPPSRHQEIVD